MSTRIYEGLTKCSTSSLTVNIREGFWAGYRKDSLVTADCPVEFCHYTGDKHESADILLPQTSLKAELDDFICGPFRTGVLCGDCLEGRSAYYHSLYFSCRQNNLCIIGWLFFILSELELYTSCVAVNGNVFVCTAIYTPFWVLLSYSLEIAYLP